MCGNYTKRSLVGYTFRIEHSSTRNLPNATMSHTIIISCKVDSNLDRFSGNPNDKVLFARCRSMPGRLERRHSLRLWGSARRLHRSGSSRSLPRRPERSDTSSSAEYASTDSAPHSPTSESDRGRDCVVMGDRSLGKCLLTLYM